MTDLEKLFKLKNDKSYFTKVYEDHREYSLNFMRKMNNDSDLIKDIYQDAVIVLYENTRNPNFQLTCSIQTYINSICRNQLLNKYKEKSRFLTTNEDFDSTINDWYDQEYNETKDERINSVEIALKKLKEAGGNCYEILTRYFYNKQSMDEIASEMNYSNGDNVKNQKSRCQKKIKELVL
jgi:RNA polymerase sigma factor (sigma-70 family)